MQVSFQQVKEQVDMLPIGFYAHTRVKVDIDPKVPTSMFNPNTREITVSYRAIERAMQTTKDTNPAHFDALVRSHLYHELSHAMLTPKEMHPDTARNIFEDERIETLLADYYHNVDFKAACKEQNDFDNLQPPQNRDEQFFHLCRFRLGEKALVERVQEIIEKHQHLNWNSDDWGEYAGDIADLYSKMEDSTSLSDAQKDFDQQKEEAKQRLTQQFGDANLPEEYDEKRQSQEQGEGQQEGEGEGENKGQDNKPTQEEEKDGKCEEKGGKGASNFNPDELFNDALTALTDSNFYKQVEAILQNFNRRNKGGNSMSAYSGVFNPRAAGREDYRYFDRRASIRGGNQYGSLHLNLFVDDSGSFSKCASAANAIIASLCELERRYDFFTLDICLCGDAVLHCPDKSKAVVNANCGTHIDADALNVVKFLQKKNTMNYNIVLYDGWATSYFAKRNYQGAYKPFDLSNATLILDPSCASRGGDSVANAKVIYSKRYLADLQKNILTTLQNAFR
jgi:hypothetical protein